MKTAGNYAVLQSRGAVTLLALTATLLWGSAFPAVKLCMEGFQIAQDDIPSRLLLAGMRFTAAGVLVAMLCRLSGQSLSVPRPCRVLVSAVGLLTTSVQYAFNYMGLIYTTGGRGAIWGQVSTFLLVLCAGLFEHNDRLTPIKAIGSFLGLSGVLLANLGGDSAAFLWRGDGFLLLGALASTAGMLMSKRVLQSMRGAPLTAWQMLLGGGALLALGAALGGRLDDSTPAGLYALVYLILVSSVAYGIWAWLTKRCVLSEISVYRFGIPFSGVIISGLLTSEKIITITNLLSLLLITFGMIVVNRPSLLSIKHDRQGDSGHA